MSKSKDVSKNIPKNLLKNLQSPRVIEFSKVGDDNNSSYARFVAEPFEKGLGVTIGNALRRVLMSCIEGISIVSVKFDGISHEFEQVPGLKEDLVYFLLNLKKVRFKSTATFPLTLDIQKDGPGILLASDLEVNSAITVLNPDLVLAHLNEDASLSFQVYLDRGVGFVPAEIIKESIDEAGLLALDSFFSPVKKVNFDIEETMFGQRTDYDKLILEVWTDESILPEDAVAYSAKILKELLTPFINFDEESYEEDEVFDELDDTLRKTMLLDVEDLSFSVRTVSVLRSLDICYVSDLCSKVESDFRKSRHYSDKVLLELKTKIEKMGLSFGMRKSI